MWLGSIFDTINPRQAVLASSTREADDDMRVTNGPPPTCEKVLSDTAPQAQCAGTVYCMFACLRPPGGKFHIQAYLYLYCSVAVRD